MLRRTSYNVITGKAATDAILEGAKRKSPWTAKYFEKQGGYEDAVKDFYSVSPKDVRSYRLSNGVGYDSYSKCLDTVAHQVMSLKGTHSNETTQGD